MKDFHLAITTKYYGDGYKASGTDAAMQSDC